MPVMCYVKEPSNSPPTLEPGLKNPYKSYRQPPSSQAMAHHTPSHGSIYYKRGIKKREGYGVPPSRRILSMGLFYKRHDEIRRLLISLGLENRERDAIFGLLRLYCHYGKTYPKAADLADDENISKRTFWRAIHKLRDLGVIEVPAVKLSLEMILLTVRL